MKLFCLLIALMILDAWDLQAKETGKEYKINLILFLCQEDQNVLALIWAG